MPDHSFTGPDICKLPARKVVDMLRKKEVSPKELLDASFARIAEVEPAVNAMVTQCPERAYNNAGGAAQADSSEPGFLGGLPIGIKDLTAVAGVRTTMGTWGLRDWVPDESGPLVERLESRGGIVVGKTNTPELGVGANTFNDVFGYTRNPYDTRKNAGGSSGGAAVSLATGEVWLSQGSDLAGSCRTPAAYNNVCGFRPTPGRAGGGAGTAAYLNEGISGPMARDIEDLALFMDAMAGWDPREPLSLDAPAESFQATVAREKKDIRIAFSPDQGGFAPVEPEIRAVMNAAMTALGKNGITVEETCPDLPDLYDTYVTLRGIFYGSVNAFMPEEVQKHFKQTLVENLGVGANLTVQQIYNANRARTDIYHRMRVFLQDYDVLAIPVVGIEQGLVEQEYPTIVDGEPMSDYIDWLRFSFLATTTGLPGLSMPCGFTKSGMPVGVQLIGPPRGDGLVMQVGLAIERSLGLSTLPIDPNIQHL